MLKADVSWNLPLCLGEAAAAGPWRRCRLGRLARSFPISRLFPLSLQSVGFLVVLFCLRALFCYCFLGPGQGSSIFNRVLLSLRSPHFWSSFSHQIHFDGFSFFQPVVFLGLVFEIGNWLAESLDLSKKEKEIKMWLACEQFFVLLPCFLLTFDGLGLQR